MSEEHWGDQRGDETPDERPWVRPTHLLLEDLESSHPELAEFMAGFVLIPIDTEVSVGAAPPLTHAPTLEHPIRHDVNTGVRRLLSAPNDVREPDQRIFADPSSVSHAHLELFSAYRAHLGHALAEADEWWSGVIRVREAEGRTREQAVAAAFDFVFSGPVAYSDVVGVIRAYWRACEAINAELPPAARVAPERMLLAWLGGGGHDSWIRALTAMPYWPIGLDAQGHWG